MIDVHSRSSKVVVERGFGRSLLCRKSTASGSQNFLLLCELNADDWRIRYYATTAVSTKPHYSRGALIADRSPPFIGIIVHSGINPQVRELSRATLKGMQGERCTNETGYPHITILYIVTIMTIPFHAQGRRKD